MSFKPKASDAHCPFCGSRDVFVENMTVCCVRVFCNQCAAMGPPVERGDWDGVGDPRSIRAAFKAWNRRTGERATAVRTAKAVRSEAAKETRETAAQRAKDGDPEGAGILRALASSISRLAIVVQLGRD